MRIAVLASLGAIVGVVLTVAAGCDRGHRGGATMAPAELTIDEDVVTFRGARLRLGSPLSEWKRALGEPSRYVDRFGGIYVWDDLGLTVSLRALFPANDPHVAGLRIFFAPRAVDLWPRAVFRGAITFIQRGVEPGAVPVIARIDAGTTASDLQHREHVATFYGYPALSRFTTARFSGRGGELRDGPIELCSVRISADARLAGEAPTGETSPPLP